MARAPKSPPPAPIERDAAVLGQVDYFHLTAAPFVWEERTSSSGGSYSVKVYTREAYTAAHMRKSAESGRLVRWGVRLAGDRVVSREGLLRVRAPEALERLRARGAPLRGEAREQALADALWAELSADERGVMIGQVDLDPFTRGAGEREALRRLTEHLRESGSLLGLVDAGWHGRVRDHYATRRLGGPVGSHAWASALWPEWIAYWYERSGEPVPAAVDPETIAAFQVVRGPLGLQGRPAPWWDALAEYFKNAAGPRMDEALGVARTLTRRLGGPAEALELGEFPADVPSRHRFHAALDGRLARLDPAWARELPTGQARGLLQPMLRKLHYATLGRDEGLPKPNRAPRAARRRRGR